MNRDLSVSIGSLRLPNPLIAASGCFGYGVEYSDVVDLATLGGVAVKGLFLAERQGHPPPRIVQSDPVGPLREDKMRPQHTGDGGPDAERDEGG